MLWHCSKEQSELDQDLEDVEEVEEEETGEETKIKARQLTVQMMQNPHNTLIISPSTSHGISY